MRNLLGDLRTALTQQTEGFTVLELVQQAKLAPTVGSVAKVRLFLKSEIAAGRVSAKRGVRPAIDGVMRPTPIYVPVVKK